MECPVEGEGWETERIVEKVASFMSILTSFMPPNRLRARVTVTDMKV